MSKLPVISGADCLKALGKIGFEVYRQRGSHITVVRKHPPAQTTIPNHKELDRGTPACHYQTGWFNRRRISGTALTLLRPQSINYLPNRDPFKVTSARDQAFLKRASTNAASSFLFCAFKACIKP